MSVVIGPLSVDFERLFKIVLITVVFTRECKPESRVI
jgi:hypothetical protein